MFHDVVPKITVQIPSLDELKKNSPDANVAVTVNLPTYALIEMLKFAVLKYKDTKYVKGIIVNAIDDYFKKMKLQHHTTSLSFDDREYIRLDVLLKLKSIAEYFETYSTFPKLHTQSIKAAIDAILGRVDTRTKSKYIHCIKTWIKKAKGQEVFYNSELDLTGFKEAVLKKFDDRY